MPEEFTDEEWLEKEKEFLRLLGGGISSWWRIEEELFRICQLILRVNKTRMAIVYYQTSQISAHLTLASQLVKTIFDVNQGVDTDALNTWKALETSLRGGFEVRNKLAHAPVEPTFDSDADTDASEWNLKYVVRQSNIKLWKPGATEYAPLVVEDLQRHVENVDDWYRRLNAFRQHVLVPKIIQLDEAPVRLPGLPRERRGS